MRNLESITISPALLSKLRELSSSKEFSVGDIIQDEDSYIRFIPIITKGSIKVMRTEEDGREILLYYIKAGESCVMSLTGSLHDQKSKIRAEIEEDAEILFLPNDAVLKLIQENPEWLEYILKLYHKRFEDLLDMVNEVTFKKVDERIWSLLEKKSSLMDSKTIQSTHEQIATELGTSRVVVSRILKSFEESGKLKLSRNKIEIV